MFIKKRTMLLSIFLLTFLSGCYPTGNRIPTEKQELLTESSDNNGTISIDHENISSGLPDSAQNQLQEVEKIAIDVCRWDNDKIADVFLHDNNIVNQREYPSDFFDDEMRYIYDTDEEFRLIVEPGRISFADKVTVGKYNYEYLANLLDKTYYDIPDGELDFPKSSAVERVERLCHKIGLNNIGKPVITAITADFANKTLESKFKDSAERSEWKKDNEVYILKYPLEYNGLPIISSSVPILGTEDVYSGSFLTAIVAKDDVVSFNLNGALSEKYDAKDTIPINFDADAALQILQEELSKTVVDSDITIYSCKMIYMPVEMQNSVFTFAPFWQIDYTQKGELADYIYSDYINAQTGILWRDYV